MHLIGLARLGKDAEVRFLPDGTAVASLALAFNYGKKNNDGKRPTQWVDASLWGERAQKLAQYLTKGTQIEVHLADPHIETYAARDGTTGSKLVAMVNHLEFAGGNQQQGGQQVAQQSAPASQRNAYAEQKGSGRSAQRPASDDFSDDVPF